MAFLRNVSCNQSNPHHNFHWVGFIFWLQMLFDKASNTVYVICLSVTIMEILWITRTSFVQVNIISRDLPSSISIVAVCCHWHSISRRSIWIRQLWICIFFFKFILNSRMIIMRYSWEVTVRRFHYRRYDNILSSDAASFCNSSIWDLLLTQYIYNNIGIRACVSSYTNLHNIYVKLL